MGLRAGWWLRAAGASRSAGGALGVQVSRGRRPRGGVGGDLVAGADVLDLVGGSGGTGEPDVGDAPAVGVADLAAVLGRLRRHLGRDAPGAQGLGDAPAGRAGRL